MMFLIFEIRYLGKLMSISIVFNRKRRTLMNTFNMNLNRFGNKMMTWNTILEFSLTLLEMQGLAAN